MSSLRADYNSDDCVDYTLENKEQAFCWITVGNASVLIKNTGEGVVVDIWAKNREDDEPDATTYSVFSDLEDDEDEDWDEEE